MDSLRGDQLALRVTEYTVYDAIMMSGQHQIKFTEIPQNTHYDECVGLTITLTTLQPL